MLMIYTFWVGRYTAQPVQFLWFLNWGIHRQLPNHFLSSFLNLTSWRLPFLQPCLTLQMYLKSYNSHGSVMNVPFSTPFILVFQMPSCNAEAVYNKHVILSVQAPGISVISFMNSFDNCSFSLPNAPKCVPT